MDQRDAFYLLSRIFSGLFVIWFCDKINLIDGQSIRGTFVNNRMVDNLGKVNFIYPTGYTSVKDQPTEGGSTYSSPSNIITSTSFSSDKLSSTLSPSPNTNTQILHTKAVPTVAHTSKIPIHISGPSVTATTSTSTSKIVTKNDFLYHSHNPVLDKDAIVQSTKSPEINFALDEDTKVEPSVPIIQNPDSIITILKQNSSEDDKLAQIIHTLNMNKITTPIVPLPSKKRPQRPGGATNKPMASATTNSVNNRIITTKLVKRVKPHGQRIANRTTAIPTKTTTSKVQTVLPLGRNATRTRTAVNHRNVSHKHNVDLFGDKSKDSKELKVQFVLDCDLKDSLEKGKLPAGIPNAIQTYHEQNSGQLFNMGHTQTSNPPKQHTVPIVKGPVYYPQPTIRPYPNRLTRPKPVYLNVAQLTTPNIKHHHSGINKLDTHTKHHHKKPKKKKKSKEKHGHHGDDGDPAVIATIKETLSKIYSFFEEALTTNYISKSSHDGHHKKKKKKKKEKTLLRSKVLRNKKRKPIVKRSTVKGEYSVVTEQPQSYNTNSYKNKQKLTTQIHVTSEYVEKEPTDGGGGGQPNKVPQRLKDEDDEDDYYGDYYGDGEYYDDFSLDDDDDSGDDDDEDDDEDDDLEPESVSVESIEDYDENVIDPLPDSHKEKTTPTTKKAIAAPQQVKKKKKRRVNRLPASDENSESEEADDADNDEYDDDDDDEGDEGDTQDEFDYASAMSSMSSVFEGAFRWIPFIDSFAADDETNGPGSRPTRSTTPRGELRKPKKPAVQFYEDDYVSNDLDDDNKLNRWYNPFLGGTSEEAATSTPPTTPSSFFNWLSGGEDSKETSTEASTEENSNWFMGLFGTKAPATTTTTTTTPRPFLAISNPLHNSQAWLGILANHMATTTPKPADIVRPGVPQRIAYSNYQLWRVTPKNDGQVDFLREYKLSSEGEKIQWWKGPARRGPTDILVSPDVVADVKETLEYESISYEIVLWDLEKAIKYENPIMNRRKKMELEMENGHPMTWYRYHEYEDITKFMDYLQRTYPEIVELIHVGRSYEGRPLTIVKISFDQYDILTTKKGGLKRKKKRNSKPGVFIEAGAHGREWISPAVATYLLRELVKYEKTNVTDGDTDTVQSVDWYILPVLNPDGYEFSHNYDRMWRKTRSKYSESGESIISMALNWLQTDPTGDGLCYGTDLNRNWDRNWNGKGSSSSPCSDFYSGPKPFSEPETRALSIFLEDNRKYLNLFISMHSYGQLLSYPTTSNSSYSTHKSTDLLDMAEVAMDSLRNFASSARYTIDNTNEMLDQRSGTSDAYAMHEMGIKYSYTLQLRDTGTHGFLLPPTYIDSTGRETFEMIKAMVDYL